MFKNNCMHVIVFVCMGMHMPLWSMQNTSKVKKVLTVLTQKIRNHKKKIVGTVFLGAGDYFFNKNNRGMFNVSRPYVGVVPIESNHTQNTKNTESVTIRQLEQDPLLVTGEALASQAGFTRSDKDKVATALVLNYGIVSKHVRTYLTDWVLFVAQQEVIHKDHISLVHGTNQGLSILVRTIFADVFNDEPTTAGHNVRNKNDSEKIRQRNNVDEFYTKAWAECPSETVYLTLPNGKRVLTEDRIKLFDKSPAVRKYLLSCNFGLFGNWISYKESSLDFITVKSSFIKYCWEIIIGFYAGCTTDNDIFFSPLKTVIKRPSMLPHFPALIDQRMKKLDGVDFLKDIFEEYSCASVYKEYQKELDAMNILCSSALLQFFIPKELANQFAYFAQPLGEKQTFYTKNSPETYRALQDIKDPDLIKHAHVLQARLFLHPTLLEHPELLVKMYMQGNQDELGAIIKRLYVIAYTLKKQQQ